MRFLADAGLAPATVDFLIRLGHEAVHVRTLGMQRAPEVNIVERARGDSSVVLTFDLDFGDILALGVLDKPSVIIFRLRRLHLVKLATGFEQRRAEFVPHIVEVQTIVSVLSVE
jgi:predicted nuclease of predicted toxin-antitoxin system